MARPPISWEDLRLVLAVGEARGLGGAAERLAIDASTVFRRLGAIEARLGLKLFERHRQGYVATGPGRDVLDLAARMDEEITGLSRRLAGHAQEPSGEVRVTTNDTLLTSILTPIFARFRSAYPEVTLDVLIANESLNLSRRDADVAVRATRDPPETLIGRRAATIGWAVYGTAGGPERLDPETARAADWVMLGGQIESTPSLQPLRSRIPAERIVYRVNTVLGLVDAVEAGIGIGPLPCFVADGRPALRRLSAPDPDMATPLWLLAHPDLRHAPRVRALLDFLAEALAAKRPQLAGDTAG